MCLPEERIMVDCIDFGDFFGFTFVEKEGEHCSAFRTVNKSTGETGIFNPIQNLKLLDTCIKIPLDEVLGI